MKLEAWHANWFDLLVVVMVLLGLVRGRKRGISEELLDVFQWLIIVVLGGLVYQPFGKMVAEFTHMSLLYGYVTIYIFTAVMVKLVFTAIKKMVGEKLVHADTFGKMEFTFGMLAGGMRYACMLVVALALLNARYYTKVELAAQKTKQKDALENLSFLTLASLQKTVFADSMIGPEIKKHLHDQLISTEAAGGAPPGRTSSPSRRSRALDDVLGGAPTK
ncbi:MAG: CvpA family protein [Chloroflexi bacterium]|nr:CvpA family protein [Chloroflexota bacterium]